ncbi:hypothetical protein AVEN_209475-1 [Araneus ventricosus]|uniref:Uncharacterized protein n=1 Tax=Araneus ventricosus TaxID=182803 RepID=A0A4Y2HC10_ARAVE|nr:hypothetical protein AVEN_209475-1 [Araneus ventricosus]
MRHVHQQYTKLLHILHSTASTASPSFQTTAAGERLAHDSDLARARRTYTADLQWNRVSSLEPSGAEAAGFPLGDRGPSSDWNFISTGDASLDLNFSKLFLFRQSNKNKDERATFS